MFCKYRVVLSIDGCGMRGVIPLRILDYLHQSMTAIDDDQDVTSWVDLFASTSASSIFTGALMLRNETGRTRYTPHDLLDFYMRRGQQVFTDNTGVDPENSIYPMTFVLEHFFGGVVLRDLRNHFLFTAWNDDEQQLFSFTSSQDRTHNMSLSRVMNACSAFRDVYPSVQFNQQQLMDASEYFRNPAWLAYQQARMLYSSDHLIMISIGVGDEKEPESAPKTQADEVHRMMKHQVLEDNKLVYFRFQPEISADITSKNIGQQELLDIADHYIFEREERFRELLRLMAIKAA